MLIYVDSKRVQQTLVQAMSTLWVLKQASRFCTLMSAAVLSANIYIVLLRLSYGYRVRIFWLAALNGFYMGSAILLLHRQIKYIAWPCTDGTTECPL